MAWARILDISTRCESFPDPYPRQSDHTGGWPVGGGEASPSRSLRNPLCSRHEGQMGRLGVHRPIRGTRSMSRARFGTDLPNLANDRAHFPRCIHLVCVLRSDPRNADALRQRATKESSDRKFAVLSGDANAMVPDVLGLVPTANKARRVLCFCFMDPYQLSNLKFATIERLSKRYVDFLVLIPSSMDANRNERVL